jgi:hypothetical protein
VFVWSTFCLTVPAVLISWLFPFTALMFSEGIQRKGRAGAPESFWEASQ